MRTAIADLSKSDNPALAKIRAEKAALEEELRTAHEDRAKAVAEVAVARRQTQETWATERMENAVLRERINDIAAEVAKLAVTLEGPNSTIADILNAAPAQNGTPQSAAVNGSTADTGGTLASRIRALQAFASRAQQQPQS